MIEELNTEDRGRRIEGSLKTISHCILRIGGCPRIMSVTKQSENEKKFSDSLLVKNVLLRINRDTVYINFIMKVRPGASSAIP